MNRKMLPRDTGNAGDQYFTDKTSHNSEINGF